MMVPCERVKLQMFDGLKPVMDREAVTTAVSHITVRYRTWRASFATSPQGGPLPGIELLNEGVYNA